MLLHMADKDLDSKMKEDFFGLMATFLCFFYSPHPVFIFKGTGLNECLNQTLSFWHGPANVLLHLSVMKWTE